MGCWRGVILYVPFRVPDSLHARGCQGVYQYWRARHMVY